MQSQIESGAELLARLSSKPSLCGLENTLFLKGPRSTDIMEIGGERSTGKSLLLSQMLAKCILPNDYRTISIQGCNASAVLINTDHHFQISKFIELMSDIIDAANTVLLSSKVVETNLNKLAIIQNSLHNLHIIDCYDSEQFFLTLRTLDDLFLDNTNIALLAIDSITAYYWQDRENNAITLDAYVRKLVKLIRMHTTRFNVMTIYTKLCENICLQRQTFTNNVDYKVQLFKAYDSENLTCILETEQIMKKICYSILSNGIKWKTNERAG